MRKPLETGIPYSNFVMEMVKLLNKKQIAEIRQRVTFPKSVDPVISNRLIEIREELKALQKTPEAGSFIKDANESLTSAIDALNPEPWQPRDIKYSCVMNYDPGIGLTTCAIDEEDRDADSRCPVVRSYSGCCGRSDCSYYSSIENYKKYHTNGEPLTKSNTGNYPTNEVWGDVE